MESIVVQGIDHRQSALRSVDSDHRVIDRIRHCGIDGPVPVRDPERRRGYLICTSLCCWVGCCNLLGIVPQQLLDCLSSILQSRCVGRVILHRAACTVDARRETV